MSLLEVSGLSKTYTTRFGGAKVEALKSVTFSVESGEYVAVMGESGSGKTTLLNLLAALDRPTGGTVLLGGQNLAEIPEERAAAFRRDHLGFVFQDFSLLDTFSLEDNILLPLVLQGKSRGEMKSRLVPLADRLGISGLLKKYPYEVSGGQKQRAAVARALITNPRIILADEPTGALDSGSTEELLRLFGMVNGAGQTIVMVTHSVRAASRAGRVLFIKDGEVYHQLYRGNLTDDQLYQKITDALAKLQRGQFIMIREGTAARNLDALLPLLTPQYYTYCMFCTDDKHPNDLLEKGHIDYIIKKAIAAGVDPIIAVKCASHHAARYFLLNNRGAIAPGFLADFVIIDNFRDFNILEVYKKGKLMFDGKEVAPFEAPEIDPHLIKRSHETFHVAHLTADDFTETRPRAVLGMVPGEIVTTDAGYADRIDLENDILKIAVIERHKNTHHIGIGYIKGYGLKSGAVATSISHDSHNIIVVGANEEDMAAAVNRVVELGGGIVVMDDGKVLGELQLQIAGIMSEAPLIEVNEALENAKEQAFKLGVSRGVDPFMTLSFMALTVIPTLRLTTRGVFDVINQRYV